MTMTELPRRPFAEQMPPVDGLESVRAAARGRRRRRAVAVTGGGVGAVATAVVATLLLAGGSGGLDVLRPVQPALHGDSAHHRTSSRQHVAPRHVVPARHHSGVTGSGPAVAAHRGAPARPTVTSVQPKTDTHTTGQTTQPSSAGPQLRRYSTSTGVGQQVTLCPGDVSSSGQSATTSTAGWCVQAIVSQARGGEQLRYQVCRDDTSSGTLSFTSTREVDFAVRQGGRTIWDWAHDHPGTADVHHLDTGSGECWNWSLVWPGITQSGASAGHGSFTFVATSTAAELAGAHPQTVSFTY